MKFSPELKKIEERLKAKTTALWKKSFRKSKANHERKIQSLLDELSQIPERAYQSKVEQIVACAERLMEGHLQEDPNAIVAITKKILKNIAEHADVEIAANPTDAALLSNALSEIMLANSSRRNMTIAQDEAIKRGSLVIKANKSIVDANLATQLNRARAILLN